MERECNHTLLDPSSLAQRLTSDAARDTGSSNAGTGTDTCTSQTRRETENSSTASSGLGTELVQALLLCANGLDVDLSKSLAEVVSRSSSHSLHTGGRHVSAFSHNHGSE